MIYSNNENNENQTREMERIVQNLIHVKHKIVVMSGKGGVGKSTVSVNLASSLALRGFQVGLLDADVTGPDIAKMVGMEDMKPEVVQGKLIPPVYDVGKGIKVMSMAFLIDEQSAVIWRGPMKMSLINQFLGSVEWGTLDYLLIDLPPGTSDEPLTLAQILSFTGFALIVTTPQELALLDVKKSINFAKRLHMNILGVVENMSGFSCPHCGTRVDLFKKGGGEKAAEEMGLPFLGRLELYPGIVESGDGGKPFVLEESPARKSFEAIVDRIEERIGEISF